MKKPRDRRFPVMLTEEEFKVFKRFAEDVKHTTLSEWFRQLGHREIEESKGQAA